MLGLMGFSGSLPLYVIHWYYMSLFINSANKDACLLACVEGQSLPLIIDFTEDQQLMSEHLHTMIYHNGISAEGDLTNEDEERLVTWLTLRKLNWPKRPFEYLVIKSPFLWYRLQRSRYMKSDRSDSCDWRCWRISRWTGFRKKRWQSDEYLSRQQWLKIETELSTCSC